MKASMTGRRKNNYHVPNLDRALVILDLLSKNPTGMNRNEIAAASACSTTMVYRIAMTLADNGFLFRDEISGRYRLSSKLLDLGVAGADEYSLAHVAWPEMAALRDATGLTVMLGSLIGEFEGVVLESAESRAMARFAVQKGLRVPWLHVGGWKCILAYWPEERVRAYLDQASFTRLTPHTLTSRKAVLDALKMVRRLGYAADESEMTEGNHCAVAPIFDRKGMPVGPLCLSGLATQLPVKDFAKCGRLVREAAGRISAKLGWNGNDGTRNTETCS
ncbi:MAG TPA: IclR family transcriptional regulator [Kiritimatiellia bacterium]|nr:IclR family transcriptional regulator [Kiritimatiellia bacterium]HPS08276.1 IclR family transcriptional regulator [Kiritimatiellia bacterium]